MDVFWVELGLARTVLCEELQANICSEIWDFQKVHGNMYHEHSMHGS